MATRIFLGLSTAIWLPYGILCFFTPGFLEETAGVAFISPTGSTEIRAMYGGLQAAIGAMSLTALIRPELRRGTLTALLFLTAGLATARLLGVALDGAVSTYTLGGLGFELSFVVASAVLLQREGRVPASL